MKTTLLKALAVFSAFILVSCEGNTNYNWIVRNRSSTQIHVTSISFADYDTVFFTIDPDGAAQISEWDILGGSASQLDPIYLFFPLIIYNENGDTTTKKVYDKNNWDAHILEVDKIPSSYNHDYFLTLNDDDF